MVISNCIFGRVISQIVVHLFRKGISKLSYLVYKLLFKIAECEPCIGKLKALLPKTNERLSVEYYRKMGGFIFNDGKFSSSIIG